MRGMIVWQYRSSDKQVNIGELWVTISVARRRTREDRESTGLDPPFCIFCS